MAGVDPEGGFGDLSSLKFLEVKIILNVLVNENKHISVDIFSRDPNGDSCISNINLKKTDKPD